MEEVWKSIDGYDGRYEVSNLGRVRSLEFRNNQTAFSRTKIMKATDNGHGYLIVSLREGGGRKNHYVHRLVAEAFIPNPDNLPVIDHIDHNRSNNIVTNLQWMTQGDNVRRSRYLMSKAREKATTNTGEKYISRQSKDGLYRVTVRISETNRRKQIGLFKTLNEALEARDAALKEA